MSHRGVATKLQRQLLAEHDVRMHIHKDGFASPIAREPASPLKLNSAVAPRLSEARASCGDMSQTRTSERIFEPGTVHHLPELGPGLWIAE